MQARQRRHVQALIDASQSLIDGDHKPLMAIMQEDTPKGTIGAEKKALRQMAKMIGQGLPRRSYSLMSSDDEPLPGGEEALDTIQALRCRALARSMPDGAVNDPLFAAASAQAQLIIKQQLVEKVKDNLDQMVPMPKSIMVGYYWHAMSPDGDSLCGAESETPARNDPASPLNAGQIHCEECESLIAQKTPQMMMNKEEVEKEIEDVGITAIGTGALSWRQPTASMTAKETIKLGLSNVDEQVVDHLADFGIKAPAAFRP